MTTRDLPQRLFDEARTWIGTPWVNGGRTKGVAVSCTGMVIMAARSIGIFVEDIPLDEARASGKVLRQHLVRYCNPIPNKALRTGALVLMYGSLVSPGTPYQPTHIGVLGQVGAVYKLVHVPMLVHGSRGYCVEGTFDPAQHGLRSLWWFKGFESCS